MDTHEARKRETDALIELIWGPRPPDAAPPLDPAVREQQNKALSAAMKAYLQQYLGDLPAGGDRSDLG